MCKGLLDPWCEDKEGPFTCFEGWTTDLWLQNIILVLVDLLCQVVVIAGGFNKSLILLSMEQKGASIKYWIINRIVQTPTKKLLGSSKLGPRNLHYFFFAQYIGQEVESCELGC